MAIILELAVMAIAAIISAFFFLLTHFDVTNAILVSGLIQLLNLKSDWSTGMRLGIFLGLILLFVVIQHTFRIGRIAFSIFSIFVFGFFGYAWKNYDTRTIQLTVMAVCMAVGALLNWLSWNWIKMNLQGE